MQTGSKMSGTNPRTNSRRQWLGRVPKTEAPKKSDSVKKPEPVKKSTKMDISNTATATPAKPVKPTINTDSTKVSRMIQTPSLTVKEKNVGEARLVDASSANKNSAPKAQP